MKKKSVKMAASIAILAVLCGAYFGVKSYVAKQEQQDGQQEETVTNVISANETDIKSLKFMIDKKEVTFEKDNDNWVKADEKEFPVSQEKIEEAEAALASIDADRVLEKVENLYEYGLDEPQNTITVTTNDDKQTVIRVGIENESTSQYYVNKDDEKNTVYVVPETSISPFMNTLYDYAQMEEFPEIEAANISKIQVDSIDTAYTLEKQPDDGFWYLGADTEAEQADTSSVSTLTSALSSITYKSFANYNCTDLSDYGLSEPSAIITVDYEEGTEDTGDVESTETESAQENEGEQEQQEQQEQQNQQEQSEIVQKQLVILIGDDAGGDAHYISVNDSSQIYTISDETLSTFLDKDVSDFWNMTVSYVSANQLDSMEVKYNNYTHIIDVSRETSGEKEEEENEEEQNEVTTYHLDGKEIDTTSFSTFFNKLVNMTGQKRLAEEYTADKESEMEVSFYTNNNTDISVKYYNYDTNFYAAVVNDKVYLVNKMSAKEMLEAFEKLLNLDE